MRECLRPCVAFVALVEPTSDRPDAPGYFIREYTVDLLPWSWAIEVMDRARNPVLATVRPDGRAHAMPVWGIWLGDVYCVSTAITSVKSKNLIANPECSITSSDGDDAVVIEGQAALADPPGGFTDAYEAKYGTRIESGPIWVVHPRVAFGFQANESFYKTATRWRFG